MSESNYVTAGGEFERLPNENDISALGIELFANYSFNRDFRINAYGAINRVAVTDQGVSTSNFTMEGIGGGLSYVVWKKYVRVIFKGKFHYTLDDVSYDRTDPLTADGISYVLPELYLYKKLGRVILFTNLGARFPTEGLASHLFWGIGSSFQTNKFQFGAQLRGTSFIGVDEFSLTPSVRTDVTDRVNGTSLLYYAPDPELLDITLWGGMKIRHNLSIALGFNSTIDGKNSANSSSFLFGIRYEMGKKKKFRKKTSRVTEEDFKIESRTEKISVDDEDSFTTPTRFGDDGMPLEDTEQMLEDRINRD